MSSEWQIKDAYLMPTHLKPKSLIDELSETKFSEKNKRKYLLVENIFPGNVLGEAPLYSFASRIGTVD